jgi:hypothetical protein
MRKRRLNPGDVICVPIADDKVVVGIVLHISNLFRNAVLVGFYKQLFPSCDAVDINLLGGDFIWIPNYTGKKELTDGTWQVIGNSPKLLHVATIPHLVVVSDVYFKDEVIRHLNPDEANKYPILSVAGGGAIEARLKRHFAL